MAKLIYSVIASLDGYVEDEQGKFDWAAPNDEVLAFVNDLERPIGTCLYGRRMYETMVYWETAGTDALQSAMERDFAEIWRAAEKIVFSRTGTRRRVPAAPRPDHRGRGEARAAGRCPGTSRAARRAAHRRRRGLPPLPRARVTSQTAGDQWSFACRRRAGAGRIGIPRLDRPNLGGVRPARGLFAVERGRAGREGHRSIGRRASRNRS